MDKLGDNIDLSAVEIVFSVSIRRRIGETWRIVVYLLVRWRRAFALIVCIFRCFDDFFRDLPLFVNLFLCDKHGIAVEIRIGEIARGCSGVVQNIKPQLAVVLADASAAPDDLLELHDGIDQTH